MAKKLIVLILLMAPALFSKAQSLQPGAGDIHSELITPTWELFVYKSYKYKQENGKSLPIFPDKLKSLEHKEIQLPGYIIAIKAGMMHDMFMLSVLPVQQCAFCGAGQIPPMMEVHMAKPIRFTDNVVMIKGKLNLNASGDYKPEFSLTDAQLVER